MLAANKGDAATVEALLGAGADANLTARDGRTALMEAAGAGSLEAVRALVAKGAEVNAKAAGGMTALERARRAEDNAQVVEALRQAGAK
jgi:ankyrin repeat protein